MADFSTAVTLEVEVDEASLREARADIEDDIGPVPVGGGGSTAVPDGGGATSLAGGAVIDELGDQTDLLGEILDEIEEGGLGGGGGGGGIPGGGILSGLGAGRLAGGAAGLGALGALATFIGTGGASQTGGVGSLIPAGLFAQALNNAPGPGESGIPDAIRGPKGAETGIPSVGSRIGGFIDTAGAVGSVLGELAGGGAPISGGGGPAPEVSPALEILQSAPSWLSRFESSVNQLDTAQLEIISPSGQVNQPPGAGPATIRQDRVTAVNDVVGPDGQVNQPPGAGPATIRQERARSDQASGGGGATVQVNNEVRANLDISGERQLRRFLRDPQSFIESQLNLSSGPGGR